MHSLPADYSSALVNLAPSIVFSATKTEDHSYVWDGDGPDPIEQGFSPYTVCVSAETIWRGVRVSGSAYLGGCYYADDEEVGDVNGYLNSMLEEAATNLLRRLAKEPGTQNLVAQLDATIEWLTVKRREEYEAQRAAR